MPIKPTRVPRTRKPTKNPTLEPTPGASDTRTDEPESTPRPTTPKPTSKNRGQCENNDAFRFNDNPKHDCNNWVSRKPEVRCGKVDPITNKKVKFYCPLFCKAKCKTPSPTSPPTPPPTNKRGPCENNDAFRFKENSKRDCNNWVSKKPKIRCGKVDPITNKKVKFYCPLFCKGKCKTSSPTSPPTQPPTNKRGPCENNDNFRFKENPKRDCNNWVSRKPNVRCRKVDPFTNKKVKFYCPLFCKPKCKTLSPTVSPTSKTLSPTMTLERTFLSPFTRFSYHSLILIPLLLVVNPSL